jgi:hypothetical protein
MITAMRWIVTLKGSSRVVDWLVAEFPELSPVEGERGQLRLEFDDPEGDATGDEAPHAGKAVIDAYVRRLNGFGRLRWARSFEAVSIAAVRTIDSTGKETQHVFPPSIVGHTPFEDFADMVERQGHPRPPAPDGLDDVNALDGEAVTALAAENPNVALVLRLVDDMLVGDDEIDWGAAYSALEAIEHDLRDRGANGRDLGWWTRKERENLRATANSVEVLAERARHGKPFGLTEARMNSTDASWLVRRAAARWVTWLLEQGDASAEQQTS